MKTKSQEDREWGQPWLEVCMWWCGDEGCDCTQPEATVITPNITAGPPWILRNVVWQGRYLSTDFVEPGEAEAQRSELKAAATVLGVDLDENGYGRRPVRLDMCLVCGSNVGNLLEAKHFCSSMREGKWVGVPWELAIEQAIFRLTSSAPVL